MTCSTGPLRQQDRMLCTARTRALRECVPHARWLRPCLFCFYPFALCLACCARQAVPSFGVPASPPPVRASGVTFAEPYIMLSQLHWGHSYGPNPTQDAIKYLNELLEMKSAKREFFSNLGLLQYSQHNNGMCVCVCMCVWGVLVLA